MKEIQIYPHSLISTVPLNISWSDEEVVIGSSSIDSSFIKSTQTGLEAIELLNKGCSLSEAEDILSEQYRQNVSIKELIKILSEVNLISSIDGIPINVGFKAKKQLESQWTNIANVFFSRFAYRLYLLLFITAIVVNTHQFLNIQQLYSSVIQFAIQFPIVTIFIAWLLVLKHEWFHYLAAISLGVPAKIKIGSRYIFIVLETQSDAINLIDKSKRYRFYFAGMMGDILVVVMILLLSNLLTLFDINIDPRLINLCLLQTVAGIVFQFDIFFKTDLYFALTECINKENLYTNSGILLKGWFSSTTFSKELESDTTLILFSLGRLFNYLLFSIIFVLNAYLSFTRRELFEHVGFTIHWNGQYIYGLFYCILLFFVNIRRRKICKDYTVTFCSGGSSGR